MHSLELCLCALTMSDVIKMAAVSHVFAEKHLVTVYPAAQASFPFIHHSHHNPWISLERFSAGSRVSQQGYVW